MTKTGLAKCKDKALIIDSFGQPFTFMLPNGQKRYRSLVGAVMTLITILVVSLYAIYKYNLLIERSDISINEIIREDYFNDNEGTFSPGSGFNIAVGIAGFKAGKLFNENLEYGRLSVSTVSRVSNDRPTVRELKTRPCKADDIPLSGEETTSENSQLYPTSFDSGSLNMTAIRT